MLLHEHTAELKCHPLQLDDSYFWNVKNEINKISWFQLVTLALGWSSLLILSSISWSAEETNKRFSSSFTISNVFFSYFFNNNFNHCFDRCQFTISNLSINKANRFWIYDSAMQQQWILSIIITIIKLSMWETKLFLIESKLTKLQPPERWARAEKRSGSMPFYWSSWTCFLGWILEINSIWPPVLYLFCSVSQYVNC